MKSKFERYICFLLSAAFWLVLPAKASAQQSFISEATSIHAGDIPPVRACPETGAGRNVKQALRLICARAADRASQLTLRNVVVVGFVGGFVNRNDSRHPEVQFAAYLRDRYSSSVHAEVFANHEGQNALRRILELLDADGDGRLTEKEKDQASIIIYGHVSKRVTEPGHSGAPHRPDRQRAEIRAGRFHHPFEC